MKALLMLLRLGADPKTHAKQRTSATMVVACRPNEISHHVPQSALPHGLPPVGGEGRLLAAGRQRRRAIARQLAVIACGRYCQAASKQARRTRRLLGSDLIRSRLFRCSLAIS